MPFSILVKNANEHTCASPNKETVYDFLEDHLGKCLTAEDNRLLNTMLSWLPVLSLIKVDMDTNTIELNAVSTTGNVKATFHTTLTFAFDKQNKAWLDNYPNYCNRLTEKHDKNSNYDIMLIEKPDGNGLSGTEMSELIHSICFIDGIDVYDVLPIKIHARTTDTAVIGFIKNSSAGMLDYDYMGSGLTEFVSLLIDEVGVDKGSPLTTEGDYDFRNLKIHIKFHDFNKN